MSTVMPDRLRHSICSYAAIFALVGGMVAAGCAAPSQTLAPVAAGTETVAFTVNADRVEVVDAATALLVGSDFTITLANERLGLLQTDYASVAGIAADRADTVATGPLLRDLFVRLTVNVDERGGEQLVQIKGAIQRMGPGRAPDRLLALYWMERLASDLSVQFDGTYGETVSPETYERALDNAEFPVNERRAKLGQGARAVGIVAVVLFAATLLTGVFSPSSSG